MVLCLCQASDDADQNRVIGNAKLVTKLRAPRCMVREQSEIESERNHFELIAASDTKLLTNLDALLFANHDQSIGDQPRQQSFNREEQSRSTAPVIAVKDVAMI